MIYRYANGFNNTKCLFRLRELVWRLLLLTKIHKGLDKLDLYSEHLIQLKVIKGLEEKASDYSLLLKLVLNHIWIKVN